MAIIKTITNNNCWQGCGKKETPVHCWWDFKLVQPLWITDCMYIAIFLLLLATCENSGQKSNWVKLCETKLCPTNVVQFSFLIVFV